MFSRAPCRAGGGGEATGTAGRRSGRAFGSIDNPPAHSRLFPLPGERNQRNARLGQTNTSAWPWTLPRGRRVPQGEWSQEAAGLGLFLPPHTHLALPTARAAVTAGISFALLGLHCRHLLGTLLVCAGGKRQRELKTFLGRRGGSGARGHTGIQGQGMKKGWAETGAVGDGTLASTLGGPCAARALARRGWEPEGAAKGELAAGQVEEDPARLQAPAPPHPGHSLAPVEVLPGPPLSLPRWPGSTPPALALRGSTPAALSLPCPRIPRRKSSPRGSPGIPWPGIPVCPPRDPTARGSPLPSPNPSSATAQEPPHPPPATPPTPPRP